ncbi:MAG: zinc dependent phospholipase C family protein [Clostridia bacterium]|nr:zinc dependent phospholipase C family protein [Clostridia bacterium]MDD4375438.1 zinc dependent phospholipase C family protein [Clostridia bacterium]
MGSLVMHLCIGKKIASKIKQAQKKEFLIGNLAPDLSKITNLSKNISHYLKKETRNGVEMEVPDLERFVSEYKDRLGEPFIQGYLCHLISDDLWFREYIPNHVVSITEDKKHILLRDIDDYIPYEEFRRRMYKDYAKTNEYLYELYKINLKQFDDMKIKNPKMKEFEYEEIHQLIEQISFYLEFENNRKTEILLDDLEKTIEELDMLSREECVTYIEEATEQVKRKIKELEI